MVKHEELAGGRGLRQPGALIGPEPTAAHRPPPTPRRSRKPLVAVLMVALAAGALWLSRGHRATAPQGAGAAGRAGQMPVPVVGGTVSRKDVPIYLDGLGTVQAFNTVAVRPQVDGPLIQVAFVEGQEVKAGDLLAQIDPAPFRIQVAQAEARKAQDEAQLANAQLNLKRDQDLLTNQVVAQQVCDSDKALVDQFLATVKADQAAIDNANLQLSYTRVVSPIDGRTGIRLVDAGNLVHANDTNGVVVITQLKPISVLFTLPERNLLEIQQQAAAGPLTTLAVGGDNRTVLDQGQLAVIDNQIDTLTGTIRLKATFPNSELRLWPGQFVNVRLLVRTIQGGTVVPASVIQRGPEGAYAFVIGPDLHVKQQPVEVAQMEGGEALVTAGLQPGQQVVVDGQYKLQPNSQVKLGEAPKGGGRAGEAGAARRPTASKPER